MLTKTNHIEKVYYSIGEVADLFEVNSSLIRFWEKEFPQLQPKKNNRGNRVYNKKDIALFREIHHLVKEKGFTLDGAKNVLKKKTNLIEEENLIQHKLLHIRNELTSIASAL